MRTLSCMISHLPERVHPRNGIGFLPGSSPSKQVQRTFVMKGYHLPGWFFLVYLEM